MKAMMEACLRGMARPAVLAFTLLVVSACGTGAGDAKGGAGDGSSATPAAAEAAEAIAPAATEYNTYISEFIQVDACPDTKTVYEGGLGDNKFGCVVDSNGFPVWGPDANLFLGNDPADASHSINRPNPWDGTKYLVPGTATWIDWDDVPEPSNHVMPDWQLTGKDPSAFPQSNACVGPAKVLSKMDLVNIGFANNTTFAYLAVQRSGNNGDAGYYWIFTQAAPIQDTNAADCSAGQYKLSYKIQAGDILLVGHYHPSATLPLLQAFKAKPQGTAEAPYIILDAVSAINYENTSLWTRDNEGKVVGVAVNTTPTAPSTKAGFTLDGMTAIKGTNLDTETFAEAAIYSNFFTGGKLCGVSFYVSVITRSSGSGGTSPDLKDLSGPHMLNFGNAAITATASPSCAQKFGYEITSFKDMSGVEIKPATCKWTLSGPGFIDDFAFDSSCDSYQPDPKVFFTDAKLDGEYTLKVTADDGTGCTATADVGKVLAFPPLGVDARLTSACTLEFNAYADVPSGWTDFGGSGSYTWSWAFSSAAGGTPTPTSATSRNYAGVKVDKSALYRGDVTITDARTDVANCAATDYAETTPYEPVKVSLGVTPASLSCTSEDMDFSTAATFTATATGGKGPFQFVWTGDGAACSDAVGSATRTDSCVVNSADTCSTQGLTVKVTDEFCGDSNLSSGAYTKKTTVTASVTNP